MAEKTREEQVSSEQRRALGLQASEVDTENKRVKISFASEKPVERWSWDGPYNEVLRMTPEAVDLNRMNDGGAVLFEHQRDKQIGVVERAWIGEDKRAHAIVRFSQDNPLAVQEFNDIVNGVRKNISFGYQIKAFDITRGEKGQMDTVTSTSTEVLEISTVSVPADKSIGIGRSEEIKSEQGQVLPPAAADEKRQERVVKTMDKTEEQTGEVKVTESREDQILTFGRKFGVDERWLKGFALNPTNTVEGLRTEMQKQFEVKTPTEAAPEDPSKLGLSEKEAKRYSISRAIMGSIDPKFAKAAGFEMECHDAIVARGLQPQSAGFFVPTEVQSQKRTDLTATGGLTTGGALVGVDFMPESFIDVLRNNMATNQLGITIMSGLTGNPSIPRQDTPGTAYWIGEGGTPTESNISFGQLALSPHSLGAVQEFTRQLLIQSAPSVDVLVMNDIAAILARAIDLAIIDGSGISPEPKGVLQTTGVDEVSQVGANFAWVDAVAFETALYEGNAFLGTPKWLMRPSVAGALKTTQKTPGAPTGLYLLNENGTMNGYGSVVSTQVPAETLIFGDWRQVILAEWGSLEIVANDRGQTFRNGNIEVRGLHMVDVQVRYPQALKKLTAFTESSS